MRTGLGLQSAPANLVLISLSLFMTFFVMAPTFDKAWRDGLQPLMDNTISQEQAFGAITEPFREFMLSQVREKDIALFEDLSRGSFEVTDRSKVDLRILIPAFMISELRRGFEIGFLIVLPFLVIDMIVAALTMSMGMMMLPPSVISLPVKLLFFVLVDGWNLLVGSLVRSRELRGGNQPRARVQSFSGVAEPRGERPMSIMGTAVSGMLGDSPGCRTFPRTSPTPTPPATRTPRPSLRRLSTRSAAPPPPRGGVTASRRSINTLQGSVVGTSTTTDLAIQGDGYFVVSDASGDLYLTRNGSFVPDAEGNLVNSAGYYLMGYNVRTARRRRLAGLVKVNTITSGEAATPTTAGTLAVNLPSTAAVDTRHLPSANTAASTYTEETSVVAYDNLGGAHTLNVYFTNTGTNAGRRLYLGGRRLRLRRRRRAAASPIRRDLRDPDADLQPGQRRLDHRLAGHLPFPTARA